MGQLGNFERLKNQTIDLKQICEKLQEVCPTCFVNSVDGSINHMNSGLKHVSSARTCLRGLCLRCLQQGHDARCCGVMPIPNAQRMCCRECYLNYAGGED